MKAVVLGAGGLGRTIALELAADRRVNEVVIVDRRGDRARALQSIGRNVSVTALQVEVSDPASLRRALAGADVAVNATLPDHNLAIMRGCLDAGCGYTDTSGAAPIEPGERSGVLEQLDLDDAWRDRGLAAIVSMGSDPGLSNVMARIAADRFMRIKDIRIRWAASGSPRIEGYPLYSREMFIRDALSRPIVWDGGKVVEREIASEVEEFEFPPPVGRRAVHLFGHEEVLTLPVRLGKPIGHVDYKHAIDPNLTRAVSELNALGLLSGDRRIRIGDRALSFREAFLATFPEPSTLIGPLEGTLVILVEVTGTRSDGGEGTLRVWTMLEHREANRRRGTTSEYFLTAASASTALILIGTGKAPRPGVLAPEELPPEIVLPDLEARGIRFQSEERAA